MPSPIRHDDVLLRLIKDVNDIRSALRRVASNLPLFDIASENTPPVLTTNQNNYAPGSYDVLRISSSRLISISGISGGMKGRSLRFVNVGSSTITFKRESTLSLAANRLRINSYVLSLEPRSSVTFYYDSTDERWYLLAVNPTVDPTADPVTWQTRTSPLTYLLSVAWSPELGLFAAVGQNGNIVTSPDGIIWTSRTSPSVTTWNCVTWSPELGLFAAVAGNAVMTSPDGIVWSSQTPASANSWQAVAWSPTLGLFAAVSVTGAGNRVMTSPNGVNWTSQTSAEDRSWRDITWSPSLGLFIAVTDDGSANGVMTSANGTLWTARASGNGSGVIWSPTLGLAISVKGGTIYKSTNGTAWSSVTPPAGWTGIGGGLASVSWSADIGVFVAVRPSQSMYSYDGNTWTSFSTTPSAAWNDVAYSSELGTFLAVAFDATTQIMTGR